MSQSTHCTIPLPAGALYVDDWELGRTGADGLPNVYRGFIGTSRTIDCDELGRDIAVEVNGLQRMDGRSERSVEVSEIDGLLTLATARELGVALILAVEEAEEMAGNDRTAERRSPTSARHPSGWRADVSRC